VYAQMRATDRSIWRNVGGERSYNRCEAKELCEIAVSLPMPAIGFTMPEHFQGNVRHRALCFLCTRINSERETVRR
jgi:hypothetical protein